MFALETQSDDARGYPLHYRKAIQQTRGKRQPDRPGRNLFRVSSDQRKDEAVMGESLQALNQPRRAQTPLLNLWQAWISIGNLGHRPRHYIRRRHRALNSQVDADTTDRRHRMGRIANGDQARHPQSVHRPVFRSWGLPFPVATL